MAKYYTLKQKAEHREANCKTLENSIPGFVKKFDKVPEIGEQRIFLRGYLGRAYYYEDDRVSEPNPDRMRIYLSPELNGYVEFDCLDYLYHEPIKSVMDGKSEGKIYNGLEACNIWLRAKCCQIEKGKAKGDIDGTEKEIDLLYGGHGYELGNTRHYLDGEMLGFNNGNLGGATAMGCGPKSPTCPNGGCGPKSPTCPNGGCGPKSPTCPNGGCDGGGGNNGFPLPTGMLCDKYATVVGCDEWDFRKNYSPY